ncbi:MAG: sensor histidine kinase, partial [Thermoflexaceae bacterium]|nr:sensor histidine kinase [Thermoflexaceae bacterium]
ESVVTVKTVGYTGWKIVYVVKRSSFEVANKQMRWLAVFVVLITVFLLIFINQFISLKVAKPIEDLDDSVKELENGNLDVDIYIGGTHEIQHLGQTLNTVVSRLRQLMDDVVREQEEKRKSELDALQSQINPHFLYNTLDSIVWMIEGERYEEAIFMITQLASLFRISLSKGKNVISIEDELTHAENYMNIQKVRYKNKFQVKYEIDDSIRKCCTVKLVIQPILENAIYYGMESMDGDGLITVKGYEENGKIFIHVIDNGLGMSREQAAGLLEEKKHFTPKKKGSGVGLLNVHQRIRLRFGEQYGLTIKSYPDEGTDVVICLPMISCDEYYEKEGGNYD